MPTQGTSKTFPLKQESQYSANVIFKNIQCYLITIGAKILKQNKMNNSELLERFRELEARLQKVNTELDGLRVAIKGRTFTEKKAEIPKKGYEVGED